MTGPRVVHVLTEKGKGFGFAESNREKWHGLAAYDPITGEPRKKASGPPTWTQVFGDAITALAEEHKDLVAITAAMPSGTGTAIFQKKWPERFFDVGIAEGHAVTFAGGLATQGIKPVCAIYSTFLQRAYDNIIHDIAVQHLPVIFCMDRAGLVGEDGQTHMGLYDIAYMLAVPGMTVTAPKDGDELVGPPAHRAGAHRRPLLHPLSARQGAGRAAAGRPRCRRCPTAPGSRCARAATSPSSPSARWCSRPCRRPSGSRPTGIDAAVVNCRFLKPLDSTMLEAIAREHRTIVTVEEGTVVNGFGAYLAEMLQTTRPEVRVVALGVPDKLVEQAPRADQLEEFGLTADGIARRISALVREESLEAR